MFFLFYLSTAQAFDIKMCYAFLTKNVKKKKCTDFFNDTLLSLNNNNLKFNSIFVDY